MKRLSLFLVLLLALPILASAAPVPAKNTPPPARPDLLLSVRSHAAALFSQPLVSPGIRVRTPQIAKPVLAPPPLKLPSVIAAASAQN